MSRFEAGAAKLCIDPTPDMFPFPPFWGVAKEAVYASMFVRALALKNEEQTFVFVTFDAGNGTLRLREEAARRYHLPEDHLLFCAIHNHGGPAIGKSRVNTPTLNSDSGERMEALIHDRALEVVGLALKALRPARLGYGEGHSYINVNRDLQLADGSWSQADNFDGPSDKTLAVLKIEDLEGNLICALLNHCTHANTTFLAIDADGKSKTCADFPGFTCDFLERRHPGAVILWTSGAAGNQNAIQCFRGDAHYTGQENVNYSAPNGMAYRYAQYLGERHAADACQVLDSIHCDKASVGMKCVQTEIAFDEQALPGKAVPGSGTGRPYRRSHTGTARSHRQTAGQQDAAVYVGRRGHHHLGGGIVQSDRHIDERELPAAQNRGDHPRQRPGKPCGLCAG